MRRIALVCAALSVIGCAKKENPPTDTAAAMAPAPAPAPKPITLADVSGKWDVKAYRQSDDSMLVGYVFDANADSTKWSMNFPGRKNPVPVRVVAVAGDSITLTAGPYESAVRKGVQVKTETVYRIQDGKLVGRTVAHYATKAQDSVVFIRMEGVRAP